MPKNKKREGESESIPGDELMFPPNFHKVYERPSTTINDSSTHSLPGDDHVKRGGCHVFNSASNSQIHGRSEAPPYPPPMAAVSQAKGKERAGPKPLSNQFSYSQADHLRPASGQSLSNETINVVNDFGGISDRDEDREGEEYLHAKSSPLKDGRRLDNQFIVQIDETPKARPGNIKCRIKRRSKKTEDTSEIEVKPAADSKIRTRVKNQHIPPELTQPVDTWKLVVLPTFFNWLASQEDPWNQPPSAIVEVLETICQANVRRSYSLKRDGDTSGVKSAEYKRVAQKISDWKSKLGSTAIWATNTIFECKPEEFGDSDDAHIAWADWHQEGCRFLFADVETIPPKGIFQSNVFLHVLGAHFALFAVDEKAWVPGLAHDSLNHEPWGAIAIAAAAVERAVVLWSNRDLTVEIMKRAARSKSHSIEFPKKMNARGVETHSHALFAEPKWGPRTQYYYRNIKARVKKGTWNWPEIYNLLGPHIKALQKREKSKPKVQKPVFEVADVEDDDLLEDAADMTVGGSLSSQRALSKPWISKQIQYQTPQWQSTSNPGLAQGPLSSQPIPGTRRSPYSHEMGTQLLVASVKQGVDSNSSREATAHTLSASTAQPLHCPTRRCPSPAPEAPSNLRESSRPSQYPQELRSKISGTTIPFEAAPRRSQHRSEPISSTGSTWAETPSMSHSQQYQSQSSHYDLNSARRLPNSDNYVYRYSSVQDVPAGMMPSTTSRIRKGPAPSTFKHHHSQPEAGPLRRR
ncbi:hypothetical protein Agabi119p4_9941 [Agaricus bisporus var. burnettii]|uniref:Uncharacterized protein n=1 Tax=Agaricus bisporus var. burnettii TaxID=192524 RepID=A0A8H7EXA2_AGABI|nr:hypothetical protein Agabi119p4_9941 [Agaricus bisporus var. burnettii]